MSTVFDVAIIGAGAIGNYLAGLLASQGHRVCVLEKRAETGGKQCCTGIVSIECASLLSPPGELIQFEARSARVFSPAGRSIRIERENPQAIIVNRPALDRYLADRAMREGAKYYYSTTVDEIRGTSDQVKLFSTTGQSRMNFSSRVAVIASGISPSLVQSAGLGLIRDYAQGAQTEVACKGVSEVEVYSGSQIAPGFFAWLVPTGDGYAKAGLLCQGNPKLHIERLLKHLEQQGKIADVNSLVWYGAVPLKPLQKTYSDRLIVVGDAAGQVKPTTGGGIYFGILCARIAASTLHGALTGDDLSARRLSAYQKEWHKLLKRELSIDYWALQFYRKLTDAQIEYIFGIIERHAIHESILASPDITFDWHSNVILDAIKYGSLQRALARLSMKPPPLC